MVKVSDLKYDDEKNQALPVIVLNTMIILQNLIYFKKFKIVIILMYESINTKNNIGKTCKQHTWNL